MSGEVTIGAPDTFNSAFGNLLPPTPTAGLQSIGTANTTQIASPMYQSPDLIFADDNTYTPPPVYVDPNAQWGGTAKVNEGYNTGVAGINSSVESNINNQFGDQRQGILDTLRGYSTRQEGFDRQGAKNELNKMRSMQGIMGMVDRGIKSTGVMLANRNAGNSSAALQLAKAYGNLGNQQGAEVGNQYGLAMDDNAYNEKKLREDMTDTQNKWGFNKDRVASSIMESARTQLNQLNSQYAGATLPQRIAIDQRAAEIKSQAINKLSELDATLNTGIAGVNPQSQEQRIAKAGELQRVGQDLGKDAFQFTDQAPMNMQSRASNSGLPIYTLGRGKRLEA